MKNSFIVKNKIWLVIFVAIWIVAESKGEAESTNKLISLNSSGGHLEKILVAKSSEVELSNDSIATLYNFTVIQISTGKRMVSIGDIKPSSSFNLAFDRTGTYIACYSEASEKALNKSTCLQIDVVGLRSI